MEMTRRTVLLGLLASAGDFWNRKPPEQWTPEEIDRLLTKSPWAKQVKADYLANPNDDCSGGRGTWSEKPPLPRIGRPGGVGGIGFPGSGGGGGAPRSMKSEYEATVRWESAQPILLA